MTSPVQFAAAFLVLSFGLFVFLRGFFDVYDKRRVENTPTTHCRSAALGPVELAGTVAGEHPMASLLARVPAFISQLVIQQFRQSGKSRHWVTVHNSHFRTPFLVRDETGEVAVDPRNANLWLIPDVTVSGDGNATYGPGVLDRMLDSGTTDALSDALRDFCVARGISMGDPLQCVETNLCPGDKVFVLGTAVRGRGDDDVGPIVVRKMPWRPLFIAEQSEAAVVRNLSRRGVRHMVGGALISIMAAVLLAAKADARTNYLSLDPESLVPLLLPLIILLSALAVLGYAIIIFNGLIVTRNEVDRAWANVDVVLKKRFDLIPNLVEACSGYMQHEHGVLAAVTAARNGWTNAASLDDRVRAAVQGGVALRSLSAVSESYPVLRASENFSQLQTTLAEIEQQIADRRELYNAAVTLFNTRVQEVPDCWVARPFGFNPRPFYIIEERERAMPAAAVPQSH